MPDRTLRSPLQQARGVIGRYPEPGDRYVFEFDDVARRWVHMVGVRRPLRVEWLVDGETVQAKTLRPWIGVGVAQADTVVESRP